MKNEYVMFGRDGLKSTNARLELTRLALEKSRDVMSGICRRKSEAFISI